MPESAASARSLPQSQDDDQATAHAAPAITGHGPERHRPAAAAAAVGPAGPSGPAGGVRMAIIVIMVILLLTACSLAKTLLLPLVAAIPIYFLFAPMVRWLARRGLPRIAGASLVLGLAAGVMGLGAYSLAGPARVWLDRFPQTLTTVDQKLHLFRHSIESMNAAATQVEAITSPGAAVAVSQPSKLPFLVMSSTGEAVAGILITTLTVFFLLASGGALLMRAVTLIPGIRPDHHFDAGSLSSGTATEMTSSAILHDGERLVGRYMRTTIILNAALAAALSAAFWAVGLPNPVLWGVLAGGLSFLPYVGQLIGIPVVALVSLASCDSLPVALLAPAAYAVCSFIVGNIIAPYVLGRQLALSPLAIFLWMLLWGWLWGVVGALIAVPMLVMAKIVCSRIDRLHGLVPLMEE